MSVMFVQLGGDERWTAIIVHDDDTYSFTRFHRRSAELLAKDIYELAEENGNPAVLIEITPIEGVTINRYFIDKKYPRLVSMRR